MRIRCARKLWLLGWYLQDGLIFLNQIISVKALKTYVLVLILNCYFDIRVWSVARIFAWEVWLPPPIMFPPLSYLSTLPKSSCGLGTAVSTPSGVQGRASATNVFWRISALKTHVVTTSFIYVQCKQFSPTFWGFNPCLRNVLVC